MAGTSNRSLRALAPQGWPGLLLLAVCWALNWSLPGACMARWWRPFPRDTATTGRSALMINQLRGC